MIPFPEGLPVPEPAEPSKCRRCHRKISDPVSVGYQIGPDCRHQLGIGPPKKPPRIVIHWTGPVDGQQDLINPEEINEGEKMTTTTAEREIKHCWVLTYPSGARVDLDGEVHFASKEDATKDAKRYTEDGLCVAPVPEQLTEDCVTIACSCCGTVFDEDGSGAVEHHPTVESARSVAKQCGWTVTEDGTQTCEPCSGDCDCQDDAEAASGDGETR